ncbi:FAD-dependent monooxygenase [Rhodococcus xishaensis]|uniref:FAD-binding protein n=1 Tax=Rhodococcus xishaensis TaxID=2487364 RepID=A0A438AZ36_9NOCA|nr:FAD-dependent monooxygenase [Rhodococcus xishaensis]RVW03922.1 FAD-binding protein [Rhodococcus xishaensis]
MRIGVIGSGIGGLCAAVGLQRAGAEVVVFEQATDLRPGGSGLTVFANGIRALDAVGVGERFRSLTSAKAGQLRGGQRRPDGSWLTTVPTNAVSELRVIDRAELHAMLVSSLTAGTLLAGVRAVSAQPDGVVVLHGSDGLERTDQFDLVIAADGLRSTARRTWPGDPGIRYAGYSTWRGITQDPVDLGGEAGETLGVGCRFGMAPLADGRVYWFAVATMPAEQAFDDEVAEIRRLFGDWHHPIPELVDATSPVHIHRLPINEIAGRLDSFHRGRLVLLGDAAHGMTPNLGQGGGQAMEDAATLTVLLAPLVRSPAPDTAQLEAALTRYDALRRPRTQLIAQRSRAMGQLAHVRGRAASRLRDLLLRSTPQRTLRRHLAQIQTWEPPKTPAIGARPKS